MEFQPTLKNTDQINSEAESFLRAHNPFNKDPNLVMDLTIISLASKFGVSKDVIRIRLERDGLKK